MMESRSDGTDEYINTHIGWEKSHPNIKDTERKNRRVANGNRQINK